jgi:hypothetical protein
MVVNTRAGCYRDQAPQSQNLKPRSVNIGVMSQMETPHLNSFDGVTVKPGGTLKILYKITFRPRVYGAYETRVSFMLSFVLHDPKDISFCILNTLKSKKF